MKIGILTFHCALNYGAVLQTYGLQEVLRRLGHEVSVLDYRPDYLIEPYKIWRWRWDRLVGKKGNILGFFNTIASIPVQVKRHDVYRKFTEKYLNLAYFNPDEDNTIDSYILGSDQIWNPQLCGGIDPVFFGCFNAAKNKRIISYAASSGCVNNFMRCSAILMDYIQKLYCIGVRERYLADYINKNSECEIAKDVLDPVLLAGKDVFDCMTDQCPRQIEESYLLAFQLERDKRLSKFASQVAQDKGLKLIEVMSDGRIFESKGCFMTKSPDEFVALVKNADYVVTSSFHGTAFAILFKKDFNAVNFDAPAFGRIETILGYLGLNNREWRPGISAETSSIDYSSVIEKLRFLQDRSLKFLQDALA